MHRHPPSPPFKRLLIVNRGEIAIRIARAATELAVQTVGIYSYEDRFALHRYKTDESYRVGQEGDPLGAYLNAEDIVSKAKKWNIDAIHPGYGFLSENEHFSRLCLGAGIKFIGPSPEILAAFGHKARAREIAKEAGLTVVAGSSALSSLEEAQQLAKEMGYPVTLKAISGGGGRGIRMVDRPEDLAEAYARSSSEALLAFGNSQLYLEKRVVRPRHIEVQILGDAAGNIVHLFERDCSIQRRNQKVIEVAPAKGISQKTREKILEDALKIARHVKYEGLGTVEFLVTPDEQSIFLEVNPRVQVEHTVTEMVTGVDLLQASILVAAGYELKDPLIGISSQASIRCQGTAIQCRVTTENPLKNFAPETGTLIAYRPAGGFGIRLDESLGTPGETVSLHYDSLLVKVTAWGKTLEAAATKMGRCLSEFRIRGIKHNIPLLTNVMSHPAFLASHLTTDFLTEHTDVYNYLLPKDRATKILRYVAQVTVNDPHGLGHSRTERVSDTDVSPILVSAGKEEPNSLLTNPKKILDEKGPQALIDWIKNEKRLLLTDTSMRDAHQSLFATRLRTRDILKVAPFYSQQMAHLFSLELWGGATFDTCLRFLKEDPWERLTLLREAIPNILFQMLLRGDNAVGYTNYPHWVIQDFVKESKNSGIDIFRIFDCLNQADKMETAIDEVKKNNAIAEVCLCYTGDVADLTRTKYDLKYYQDLAKKFAAMGADILCVKDMAGLLKPHAAKILIEGLREVSDLPIHLHTHDTSGVGVATLLRAAESGCHIVDAAISSMSGLTSQPSLNAVVASLQGQNRDTQLDLKVLDPLTRYWEGVRGMYRAFDPGIKATSTDVYLHEIPGGQYSNFYEQAKKVGLSAEEFHALTERYKEVNDLLGDIIKVTPSSKVVGDMALLLHKNRLTGPEYLSKKPKLDYPDSWLSFLKGHMGEPEGGFPHELRVLALGNPPPPLETITASKQGSFKETQIELSSLLGRPASSAEVLSYRLYPKVFKEYLEHDKLYGKVSDLPTPVFFYGLSQKEEIEINLELGKTLYVSLSSISEPNEKGRRSIFFKLNGFDRIIEIADNSLKSSTADRLKGDPLNESHIIAPMPGKVLDVKVQVDQIIKAGQVLLVTESMKMEYAITAKRDGKVSHIHVQNKDVIEEGDLLIVVG